MKVGRKRSQERIGLGDTGDCIAAWPKDSEATVKKRFMGQRVQH